MSQARAASRARRQQGHALSPRASRKVHSPADTGTRETHTRLLTLEPQDDAFGMLKPLCSHLGQCEELQLLRALRAAQSYAAGGWRHSGNVCRAVAGVPHSRGSGMFGVRDQPTCSQVPQDTQPAPRIGWSPTNAEQQPGWRVPGYQKDNILQRVARSILLGTSHPTAVPGRTHTRHCPPGAPPEGTVSLDEQHRVHPPCGCPARVGGRWAKAHRRRGRRRHGPAFCSLSTRSCDFLETQGAGGPERPAHVAILGCPGQQCLSLSKEGMCAGDQWHRRCGAGEGGGGAQRPGRGVALTALDLPFSDQWGRTCCLSKRPRVGQGQQALEGQEVRLILGLRTWTVAPGKARSHPPAARGPAQPLPQRSTPQPSLSTEV